MQHDKTNEINKTYFDAKKYLKFILFLIALMILYLAFFSPYIGVANNGDWQRTINKVGLDYSYNAWDENNYSDTFYQYVVNSFVKVAPIETGWFTTFEFNVSFSKILADLFSKTGAYDIRFMGLSNFILYIFGIGLLFLAISKYSNRIIFFGGLITLFIASDSYIIQYFNSFYSEIGTLLYLIMFFSLCLLYIKADYKTKLICWLFEIPISALAIFTKQQEILIIIPMSIILFLQGHYVLKEKFQKISKINLSFTVIVILLITLILPIFYMNSLNKDPGNVSSYNVIMMDILKLSKDPDKHLLNMGFNNDEVQELEMYVGQTAYTNEGFVKYGEKYSRSNELKILLKEPAIVIKLFKLKAKKLFSTVDDYQLGNFMKDIGLPYTKSNAFRVWSNIKDKIYVKSLWFYLMVILSAAVISIYSIMKEKKNYITEYYILLCLCIMNILQYITIAMGDASHDDKRHYFVLNLEFDVIFIIFISYILHRILGYVMKRNRKHI